MAKSYKTVLTEKIQNCKQEIYDVDNEIKALYIQFNNTNWFSLKILNKQKVFDEQIQFLKSKQSELNKKLTDLKKEYDMGYVYRREIDVKGSIYRENAFAPFYNRTHGDEKDFATIEFENVILEEEIDNEYDPYAIKVIVDGVFIGYVDRKYNRGFRKYINDSRYKFINKVTAHGSYDEKSFSLSSPLSSAILGLSKKGDKPMTLSNKFTLSLASLAVLGLLAACSNHTTQTPASSASSQQVASSASSSKASQTASQAENLDGTYKGTDETDQITLTISSTTGTWEELERDGEKESKPVTIQADNHTLTVGDDLKYYRLEGNQLTIEDDDRDPSDTIVLTK